MNENVMNGGEYWLLMDAVLHQPEQVPNLVKSNNALIWAVNFHGETVAEWLVKANHCEGVQVLAALGAELTSHDIQCAIQKGNVEMVDTLLSVGIKPDLTESIRLIKESCINLPFLHRKQLMWAFKKNGYDLKLGKL